jgi:hypothetical protein
MRSRSVSGLVAAYVAAGVVLASAAAAFDVAHWTYRFADVGMPVAVLAKS